MKKKPLDSPRAAFIHETRALTQIRLAHTLRATVAVWPYQCLREFALTNCPSRRV